MDLQKNIEKYAWLIVVLCLVLAFYLRVHRLGERGLAGDEKYGLLVSQFMAQEGSNQKESIRNPQTPYFTPKQFWKERTWDDFEWAITHRENGTSALYSLANHLVSECFGVSDFVLRFPSVLYGLCSIILLFFFIKRHFGNINLALLSVFLASISPYLIFFSRVARNYSMLTFWALLSTHLLLIIIDNEKKNKRKVYLYLIYGCVVFANLMTHYSIFPLFFIHFIYCLIYLRDKATWIGLLSSYLIPFLGMIYWLKFGGGQWSFHAIKESAIANSLMATVMPDDWLALTNAKSVSKQLAHILSMQFLMVDGVSFKVTGIKNAFLCVLLSIFWIITLKKVSKKQVQMGLILGSIFVSFFLFSIYPTTYLITSVFLYLIIDFIFRIKFNNQLIVFLLLLIILPILSLVAYAIQDGNTMRMMPRYIAYSYLFAIILFAWIILKYFEQKSWMNYIVLGTIILQIGNLAQLIDNIYLDKPLYYFQAFLSPRQANPYQQAADKILEVYAKGDTIIYPSFTENIPYKGYNSPEYSVQDAQYVNIYLPKNAEIIQRINKNEPNRIYCIGKNKQVLIFDLKGLRY